MELSKKSQFLSSGRNGKLEKKMVLQLRSTASSTTPKLCFPLYLCLRPTIINSFVVQVFFFFKFPATRVVASDTLTKKESARPHVRAGSTK